ncbi:MAG: hypothetical protein PHD56_12955 [Anaerostipes sp.]|nr:hypothetical protein [Anaerostipes sp.]
MTDKLKDYNQTLVEMLIGLFFYGMVITIIGFITSKCSWLYILGSVVGLFLSVCLILNMYLTIDTALDMDSNSATKFMKKRTILRMVIILVVAAAGIQIHMYVFVGIILGIMGIKISAYMQPVIHRFRVKNK